MEAKIIGLKLHICYKYSDTHLHYQSKVDTVKLNLVLNLQMLMLEILFIT